MHAAQAANTASTRGSDWARLRSPCWICPIKVLGSPFDLWALAPIPACASCSAALPIHPSRGTGRLWYVLTDPSKTSVSASDPFLMAWGAAVPSTHGRRYIVPVAPIVRLLNLAEPDGQAENARLD